MFKFVVFCLCFAGLFGSVAHADSSFPPAAPNIVLILADDMGFGDSQVYNPQSRIDMPHLEELAAEGMVFVNAHATPKCAPTRYSLASGNYHSRGRFNWGAWNYRGGSQILEDQWITAKVLRDSGYNTGVVGKWHLGGDFYIKGSDQFATSNTPEADIDFVRRLHNGPLDYGFNYSYVALRGIQASPYAYFENDMIQGDPNDMIVWSEGWHGNSKINIEGIGMPDWDSSQAGPIFMQKAIAFIDDHLAQNAAQEVNRPFFLYYPSQAPHGPWTPPDDFLGEPVKGVTGIGRRTDMVYELDVALGKLIAALDERGLTGNTLFIFMSDNGAQVDREPIEELVGHIANGGLRGFKGDIWEGGQRVPMVVKWGDGTPAGSVIKPGTVSAQLVSVIDVLATLADVVDAPLPADQAADSFSLLPILTGEQAEDEPLRDYLALEAREATGVVVPPHFAILDNTWKMVLDNDLIPTHLFELDADPAEANNLVADPGQAERVLRMKERLLQIGASERTAPLHVAATPSLKGMPSLMPGQESAVYIWKETFDGPYYLVANGNGAGVEYNIDFLASHPFGYVGAYSVEDDDVLSVIGNRIEFTSKVSDPVDVIGFNLNAGMRTLISISETSGAPVPLYSGAQTHKLQASAWRLGLSALPTLPDYSPGVSSGLFLGSDGGMISLRWSGDSMPHKHSSRLFYSFASPTVIPVAMEPHTDSIVATPFSLLTDSVTHSAEDGMDVLFDMAEETIGLTYLYDGEVRSDLINPVATGLGLPNSYELPIPSASGKPDYDPALHTGMFVWQTDDGIWHLRGSSATGFNQYQGVVRLSRSVTELRGFMLESGDSVTISDDHKEISFGFQMWGPAEEGIDFLVPDGTNINLESGENSAQDAAKIRIGDEGWPVTALPVRLNR